jgi:hypothetical protein
VPANPRATFCHPELFCHPERSEGPGFLPALQVRQELQAET